MAITMGKLEVIVDKELNTWNAYGDPNKWGTHFAMNMLNQLGGVNETVEHGVHEFKVLLTWRGLMTSLLKINS